MFGATYLTPVVRDEEIKTPPKRLKKPPKNVEEWIKSQQEENGGFLNSTEHAQWPEECSEDLSLLVKCLPEEGESVDRRGDIFGSLKEIKSDLQEHSRT